MIDAAEDLSRRAFDRLVDLFENHPEQISAAVALRAIEVGARIISRMPPFPLPVAQGTDKGAIIDDLLDVYGALAMTGDIGAAKIVLAAVDKHDVSGGGASDSRVPDQGEPLVAQLFGGGSPDDLPLDLQRQIVEFFRGHRDDGATTAR